MDFHADVSRVPGFIDLDLMKLGAHCMRRNIVAVVADVLTPHDIDVCVTGTVASAIVL